MQTGCDHCGRGQNSHLKTELHICYCWCQICEHTTTWDHACDIHGVCVCVGGGGEGSCFVCSSSSGKSTCYYFTTFHPWDNKCQHLDLVLAKSSRFRGPRVRSYQSWIVVEQVKLSGQTLQPLEQPFSSILVPENYKGGFVKRGAYQPKNRANYLVF